MAQKRWRAEQVRDAIRAMQQHTRAMWRPHASLKGFLARYFPDEWMQIQRCHQYPRKQEEMDRPGFYKLIPNSCHNLPLCIVCVRDQAVRRTWKAMEHFWRCTPKGQQPRFVHVVQTAPVGRKGQYEGGGDWGRAASQDVGGFFRVVWSAMKETLDGDLGAYASYQDFGEEGLAKRHPHLDMTLNGWMLKDGKAEKTPRFDLQAGGRARWDQRVQAHAQSLMIGAEPGNAKFGALKVGQRDYYRILAYQVRELVDLRKLHYDPRAKTVAWASYKPGGKRTKMAVNDWFPAFYEYQNRLGAWKSGQGVLKLHRGLGHMSDRRLRSTQERLGGQVPPHGATCVCSRCGDWNEVVLTAEEEAMARRGFVQLRA